jgi:hypothetical protein
MERSEIQGSQRNRQRTIEVKRGLPTRLGVTGFAVEPVELYARVRFRTAYPEVSWSFRIGPRGAIYGFGCNDHSRADPAEVKAAEEAIARVLWKDAPSILQ